MAPRAPTAYFLFAADVRDAVQQEVRERGDGKAGVAAVGRAIGERWKALTDDERQRYKDAAAARARELKEEAAAAAAAGDEGEGDEGEEAGGDAKAPAPLPPFGLPTSLVKKIACADPEVSRIGADGTRALAAAAAGFLGLLASRALERARADKRKNFRFADIERAARADRRFVEMGLPELFATDAAFAEVRARAEDEAAARHAGRKAAHDEQQGKGMRTLSSFFAAGSEGARAGAAEPEPMEAAEAAAEAAAAAAPPT